jgi:hypothetical protein
MAISEEADGNKLYNLTATVSSTPLTQGRDKSPYILFIRIKRGVLGQTDRHGLQVDLLTPILFTYFSK